MAQVVVFPEMHGENMVCIQGFHAVIHAEAVGILLAGIEGHKGCVDVNAFHAVNLPFEVLFPLKVLLIRIAVPVPPVQVAGMVDGLVCCFYQKGNAFVGGQDGFTAEVFCLNGLLGTGPDDRPLWPR